MLDTLPEGFTAPTCFSVDETDDSLSPWLEEMVDTAARMAIGALRPAGSLPRPIQTTPSWAGGRCPSNRA
jgi:hypothetical protein